MPALRAQLEALAAAGEHAQVIETLFEILEKVLRDHSDLAARYTSILRGMFRGKSERVSAAQLALFFAQLPANETAKLPDEPRLYPSFIRILSGDIQLGIISPSRPPPPG